MTIHYSNIIVIFLPILYSLIFFYLKQKNITNDLTELIKNTNIYTEKFNTQLFNIIKNMANDSLATRLKILQADMQESLKELIGSVDKMKKAIEGDMSDLDKLLIAYKEEEEINKQFFLKKESTNYITNEHVIQKIINCKNKLIKTTNELVEIDRNFYIKYPLTNIFNNSNHICNGKNVHSTFCNDSLVVTQKKMYMLEFTKNELKKMLNEIMDDFNILFVC